MNRVRMHIAKRQQEFAEHPFLRRLGESTDPAHLSAFAEAIAFWVLTFQDLLRANEERILSHELRRIARHHRAEDAGHDRWFLDDLALISGCAPDAGLLFSPAHRGAREPAFRLMAEVFGAKTDLERVVLLFALEAAGHVTFASTGAFLERTGAAAGMKYFSHDHLAVEKDHELFEREIEAYLATLVLSADEAAAARQLVDRAFDAFHQMFDAVEATITSRRRAPSRRADQLVERGADARPSEGVPCTGA